MARNTFQEKKAHVRKPMSPVFPFVLAILFAMLSGASFYLANAQLGHTMPILDVEEPVAEEEEVVVPNGGVDDPDEDVLPLDVNVVHAPDGLTVFLDPGHGGDDIGNVSGNLQEKDVALDICMYLKQYLEASNITVVMSRETDAEPEGYELTKQYSRAIACNNSDAVLCVSVHLNASFHKDAETRQSYFGVLTEYNSQANDGNEELATTIQNTLCDYLNYTEGNGNNGIKEDKELVITRETKVPSCLVEAGYLTNEREYVLLTTKDYRKKIATALANGIVSYLQTNGYLSVTGK